MLMDKSLNSLRFQTSFNWWVKSAGTEIDPYEKILFDKNGFTKKELSPTSRWGCPLVCADLRRPLEQLGSKMALRLLRVLIEFLYAIRDCCDW